MPALGEELGAIAWQEQLRNLGKFPAATGESIENPDEIETRIGPALRTGFSVAEDSVGDVENGIVFPADENDALGSENVFDELLFFALRMFEIDAQTQRFCNCLDGVLRTQALDAAGGSGGEYRTGLIQGGMLEFAD